MRDSGPVTRETIYLLADHLDAALAAGEDLLAIRLSPTADLGGEDEDAAAALSRFVARLRRLEGSILARVLQVRRRLADLPRNDVDIRPAARLFVASTDLLVDLVETFGERPETRFNRGDDPLPFLRERGLVAPEAAGLPPYQAVEVAESYRIGAVVELGPLMDMIAGLLDLLDRRYDLYGTDGIPMPVALSGDESMLEARPVGVVVQPNQDRESGTEPRDAPAEKRETPASGADDTAAAEPPIAADASAEPKPKPVEAASPSDPADDKGGNETSGTDPAAGAVAGDADRRDAPGSGQDDLHPTAASLMKALDDLQRTPASDEASKPASPAP
jgi:hypothetical protein